MPDPRGNEPKKDQDQGQQSRRQQNADRPNSRSRDQDEEGGQGNRPSRRSQGANR